MVASMCCNMTYNEMFSFRSSLQGVVSPRLAAVINHVLFRGQRVRYPEFSSRHAARPDQPDAICQCWPRPWTQASSTCGGHPNDFQTVFGGD